MLTLIADMSRTMVIGDIHGAYEALLQVMKRSEFDREKDHLICLGDVVDRRGKAKECMDFLLQVNHLEMILGNHDLWAKEWMERQFLKYTTKNHTNPSEGALSEGSPIKVSGAMEVSESWRYQGGEETVESYMDGIPMEHLMLFRSAKYYHIEKNRLYVHGGINYKRALERQDPEEFLWDRSLVQAALKMKDQGTRLTEFEEVFVGHTPTINIPVRDLPEEALNTSSFFWAEKETPGRKRVEDYASGNVPRGEVSPLLRRVMTDWPVRLCNVWMMDTGAGWSGGRLSMMDVETKEVWQSDRLD